MRIKPEITKYEVMRPNCCVHCKSFTESRRLLKWAREHGVITWWNDHDSTRNNKWDVYKEKGCYQFVLGDRIALTTYESCIKHRYQIFEYGDYAWM